MSMGLVRLAAAASRRHASGPVYLLDYAAASFSRTSEASAYDPRTDEFYATGGSAWLGSNAPRIYADGAILIEGSRTNYLAVSEDMTNASWTKLNSPAVTFGGTAVSGQSTESDVVFAVGGSAGQVRQSISTGLISQNQPAVLSAFLKRPSATSASIDWYWRNRSLVNDIRSRSHSNDDWQRFSESFNTGSGANAMLVGWIENTDNAQFAFSLSQLEGGSGINFPSSPIRTPTAGTRTTENCHLASAPLAMREGRWRVDFWPSFSNSEGGQHGLFTFDNTVGERLDLLGNSLRAISGGVTKSSVTVTYSRHDHLSILVDASTGYLEVVAPSGTASNTGTPWTWPDGQLNVGRYTSSGYAFGVIGRPEAA